MGNSGLNFCTSPFPGDKLQIVQSGLARVINDLLTAPLKAKTVKQQKKYLFSTERFVPASIKNTDLHINTFGPELFSQSQQSQVPY